MGLRLLLHGILLSSLAAGTGIESHEIQLRKPRGLNQSDISGDRAVGEAGRTLSRQLAVLVTDTLDLPMHGIAVRFRVLSEPRENYLRHQGAGLADTIVITNEQGIAATKFKFGASAGEYVVEITAAGATSLRYLLTARSQGWLATLIFGLLGGLCFFLFGLYYGSKGLRRMAGNRLREMLFSLTRRRVLGVVAGIVVTVIFQSSSATTALLVSFATTGLLSLGQALSVILGADIGTTLTVQLLAFRFFDYALILTIIGFLMMYSVRRLKDLGQAVFGFGLVFYSLRIVSDAIAPLKLDPDFPRVIAALGQNPVWGTLFAIAFTFLVRSSAATVGIAVGLAISGLLPLTAAIPIILGANVGTALTAWIASRRSNAEARRIALGHMLFKVIIVIPLLFLIPPLAQLIARITDSVPRQIAHAHTLINVAAALIFLPFLGRYERLLRQLVPAGKEDETMAPKYLDPQFLSTPAMALGQASREVLRMSDTVLNMLQTAMPVFLKNDKEGRHRIVAQDDLVDRLEQALNSYLVELSREELPPELSRRAVALLHISNELEHIGDIVSKGLMAYVKKKIDNNLAFSSEGLQEITEFHAQVTETLRMALAALSTWDERLAHETAARKGFGNQCLAELHNRHLARLKQGLKESMDTSTIHLDFISDLERINFHASAIGIALAVSLKQK